MLFFDFFCLNKMIYVWQWSQSFGLKLILMVFWVTVCIKSCKGRTDGNYQSCFTCGGFISCLSDITYNMSCMPSFQDRPILWDNIRGRCEYNSITCDPSYLFDAWKLCLYFAQVLNCILFYRFLMQVKICKKKYVKKKSNLAILLYRFKIWKC